MSLQTTLTARRLAAAPKPSAMDCENGRHSAMSGSKLEINGIVHATCRHCGCELMRLGASRRWFRTGEMGA